MRLERSGFGLQRALQHEGFSCIVVNPSDVAMKQKDVVQKSDRSDSRNLCFQLRSGNLVGIYVPSQQQEQLRSLFRQRNTVVKLLREAKVLIRAQLAYYGITLPAHYDYTIWSKQKLEWIRQRTWNYTTGKESLHSKLRRTNMELQQYYHAMKGKPPCKRIVKVAKKLLLRARAVLLAEVPYQDQILLTEGAL